MPDIPPPHPGSMFFRARTTTGEPCPGVGHDGEGCTKWGLHDYSGFCGVSCRENYFRVEGAGDMRDVFWKLDEDDVDPADRSHP